MESLNEAAEASSAQLRQQIGDYLVASHVPAEQRPALADCVLAELPQGLDGPHLWRAIQHLIDRALAREEGLGEIEDHRVLARARLGYVLAPEGARQALADDEPELASPLSEADRFSVPRPVQHRMQPQALQFWKPTAAQSLKRWLRATGSHLRPEA